MGQDISKAHTPPPLSFRDCLVDGRINMARYMVYSQSIFEEDFNDVEDILISNRKKRNHDNENVAASNKKTRKRRSIKRYPIMCRGDNGSLREATYHDSTWYRLYIEQPPVGKRLLKIFRRRFRIPYSEFVSLCNDIKSNQLFDRWAHPDAMGCESSDIRLLLLGTLRYLGRANTFDDACESTYVSGDVHRIFFLTFLEYGSTVLYEKYVLNPLKTMDFSSIGKLFQQAGFNGCVGSSDATHVGLLSCPSWAFNNNKGFKLSVPSRNYNATVTHWRQIMGTTFGHPGTWNDKTLVLFDDLIKNTHNGEWLEDKQFELLELDKDGNIVSIIYLGAWFLVDNGYLEWSTTVPPMKHPLTYEEIRFSEWLESMRKDIECTFGIMKQRFHVLKHGIRLHLIANSDKVWSTCCALHNMLLFVDGLHKGWDDFSKDTSKLGMDIPFSMQRLNRHEDSVVISPGTEYESGFFEKYMSKGKRVVRKLPLHVFQERLVHHFDIRFKTNELAWPKRKERQFKVY